jgi:hypothetical protein
MDHWFDALAKSMAHETSRRRFLERFGSGVAAAALSAILPRPGGALASDDRCIGALARSKTAQFCGSKCTDTANDPQNCGSCGRVCASGGFCVAGNCFQIVTALSQLEAQCPSGTLRCNGACTDILFSPVNCGGCNRSCPGFGACLNGQCVPNSGPSTQETSQQAPTAGCQSNAIQSASAGNGPVSVSGNGITVTVVAGGGNGAFTLAHCPSNPGPPPPDAASAFFDLREVAGSSLSSLMVTVCPAAPGSSLLWLNSANVWQPVSPAAASTASNCLTMTIAPTTSPSLSDLSGTPFALVAPAGTCIPGNCFSGFGCCSDGICKPGTEVDACGVGGICSVCGPDEQCFSGCKCCLPCSGFCPSGCCTGRECKPGTDHFACGIGGVTCQVCSVTEECVAGRCFACTISCSTGCCAGGTCKPGTSHDACGVGGALCIPCGPNQTCVNGQCQVTPTTCTTLGQPCVPSAGDCAFYGGACTTGTCWMLSSQAPPGQTGCCPQQQFSPGGPFGVGQCCTMPLIPLPSIPGACSPP